MRIVSDQLKCGPTQIRNYHLAKLDTEAHSKRNVDIKIVLDRVAMSEFIMNKYYNTQRSIVIATDMEQLTIPHETMSLYINMNDINQFKQLSVLFNK